jgi:predicted hydrolase (HD superfamily)
MDRQIAIRKLNEWVKSPSLLRHSYAVERVMIAALKQYGLPGDDPEKWALAGLLHDADYEISPEEHPKHIVEWLRNQREEEVAHAIAAHGVTWGVPYDSQLDRALVACDEITGFIIACSLLRPDGILTLEAASVIKKLKNRSFASGVDRNEVYTGAQILGVDLREHITFVIDALRANAQELILTGQSEKAA